MHRPVLAFIAFVLAHCAPPTMAAAPVPTAAVEKSGGSNTYLADGYVEAVRQTVIASQVPGRVTALTVRAGDTVKAGAVLVRIDQRAAAQQVAASEAQAAAAHAGLEAARKEYERSRRLYQKQYISQAAMEQAEAQFKASQAQSQASLAQAAAAATRTSFHALHAPYDGVVASVATELGDMAVPGKPLVTVYDPSALRIVATLPERYASTVKAGAPVRIELPGAAEEARWQTAQSVTILPTRDPVSHTLQVRLALAAHTRLAPGAFARVHLSLGAPSAHAALIIPVQAVVRRSEVTGVYVADASGRYTLRQVRLGKVAGDRVVVLAGLREGERVALDPVAAASR